MDQRLSSYMKYMGVTAQASQECLAFLSEEVGGVVIDEAFG